jgi:anthranilate synthase component 1
VARAKEHIAAGDAFQVVLARRFSVARRVEPLALYRALRLINPSPYMVLLETPEVALVGASPEMLVRKCGRKIETRPIAGTRPRGADADGDRILAEDLSADPKERSEHVMLVDLGRNDLGRVARAGSVKVASFMEVERYSHVMHLVSSVEGELDPALHPGTAGALDALLACFPAGTVSGAPKIRAMEIIDALEPEARGPYAGAVGYLSYSGDLDTCITIRTLVVRQGETSVTAGAGIVADSDPAAEERETENKAAALLAAVSLAEGLEGGPA